MRDRATKESVAGAPSTEGMKQWLRSHLDDGAHPLDGIDPVAARAVVDSLTSLEPESWVDSWLSAAAHFQTEAEQQQRDGHLSEARSAWWQAYKFAVLARFPAPSHAAQLPAYESAREYFMRAVSLDETSVERVELPFENPERQGHEHVVFYVARAHTAGERTSGPAVIVLGGIDTWKEDTYARTAHLRAQGITTIHMDIPGTGEAPLFATPGADRMFTPVFEWAAQSDLDINRIGVLGMSFGGYWATLLAHTHRSHVRTAVNWGGGIHRTFQPEWQERSRVPTASILGLHAARARIFGEQTFDKWVEHCPKLSLLDQGVLDQPSSSLLMVNGRDDRQSDATDLLLALEYGGPKTVRLFRGGHMGPESARDTVTQWLVSKLSRPDAKLI